MRKIILFLALVFLAGNVLGGNLTVESVSYDPSPAIPGGHFSLYVQLKNDSKYYAENTVVWLDLSGDTERESAYPFSLGSGVSAQKTLGTINPNKNASAEYRVYVDPSALDGDYNITFTLSEEKTQTKQRKYTITVLSRKPDIEIVGASETDAAPGQDLELDLTVRNIGSSIAKDVLIGLEEDRTVTTSGVVVEREFSSLGASFTFLDSIAPGKEKIARISLVINPEAEQKTYMIPIKLKYKDANLTSYTQTAYIGLKVGQEPELDAVISEVAPVAFPGGTSQITIDLFNVGIGTAKYVVAELDTEAGKISQEKTFIGTLEADDFDSFKTSISIKPNLKPDQMVPAKLTLKYKNQFGEERTTEKELMLRIGSAEEAQGANLGLAVLGIIGLLLQLLGLFVAARWAYRKIFKRGQK